MKKICLCMALALFALQGKAQLTNPDFEELDTDGHPVKWKSALMLAIPIDSSCTDTEWALDSLHFITEDAYSGKYALEMRNGSYCGNIYAGNVRPGKDNIDSFTYGEVVPFSGRPASVSFYYKLQTQGGDQGWFEMQLSGENGAPLAEAVHTISTNAAQWTLAEVHLVYSDTGNAASINMRFQLGNETLLHYGSRFVIDHIRFSNQSTGMENPARSGRLPISLYPVPAENELNVRFGKNFKNKQAAFVICDASGRQIQKSVANVHADNTLKLSIPGLASGLYVLQLSINGQSAHATFVK